MKKNSRTSPGVQFKKFLLTTQKTRPRTDYELMCKTISKISDQRNIRKNKCQNDAFDQKPPARIGNFVKAKN